MTQLSQFISHHLALWIALAVVLFLILINELVTMRKQAKSLTPAMAVNMINHHQAVVIDLRDKETFRQGHIISAIQANPDDFKQKKMEKYKNKPFILVCARGLQSPSLATQLRTQGFTTPLALAGGIAAWQSANLPLVKGKN